MQAASEARSDVDEGPTIGFLDAATAAGWAGLAAGAMYLVAQTTLMVLLRGDSPWAPLQRIAAILLGRDAAPPADLSLTIVGFALLIHFPLAFVYGRIVGRLVRSVASPVAVLLIGAAFGLAIYGINFGLIAPQSSPWFEASLGAITVFDHALFGATAALLSMILRRWPRRRMRRYCT